MKPGIDQQDKQDHAHGQTHDEQAKTSRAYFKRSRLRWFV